jgi:hypothetical protein
MKGSLLMKLRSGLAITLLLVGASAFGCVAPVDSEPAAIEEPASVHAATEYRYPGVYVDETPFRSNPIPGVSTGGGTPVKVIPGTRTAADAGQ